MAYEKQNPAAMPGGVLEELKKVDGSGSGLDADLLDGIEAKNLIQVAGSAPAEDDVKTWAAAQPGVYFIGQGSPIYQKTGYAMMLLLKSTVTSDYIQIAVGMFGSMKIYTRYGNSTNLNEWVAH